MSPEGSGEWSKRKWMWSVMISKFALTISSTYQREYQGTSQAPSECRRHGSKEVLTWLERNRRLTADISSDLALKEEMHAPQESVRVSSSSRHSTKPELGRSLTLHSDVKGNVQDLVACSHTSRTCRIRRRVDVLTPQVGPHLPQSIFANHVISSPTGLDRNAQLLAMYSM